MSDVHYFQRYSQRENVDTNNTLLFLARLQAHDFRLLKSLLAEFFRETEVGAKLEVGVRFTQQATSPGGSVPDAVLFQQGFRIIVETKRHSPFTREQLKRHLDAFGSEDLKVLLLLSPQHEGTDPPVAKSGVLVVRRTFSDLIAAARALGLPEAHPLRDLIDDFEEYCADSRLISGEADRAMVVPVGSTLRENQELALYYAPVTRRYQPHAYLGLYARMAVRAIGKLENRVEAELVSGKLRVLSSSETPTRRQKDRVQRAMESAPGHGYDISTGYRFFLVESFAPTHFRKVSPGGLLAKRYLQLRDALEIPHPQPLPVVARMAEILRGRTWE